MAEARSTGAEASAQVPFGHRRLVLSLGPGGVGKTTTAAALALRAAEAGRKVAVVTVDPARRLGQALGLSADAGGGELVRVLDPERDGAHLDALLLDSAAVFDEVVRAYAPNRGAADRIVNSKIYRATRERLGGAIEFAAMARVLMLHTAGDHDYIVLDTPPTANALDFLGAPARIRELAENPAARMVTGTGRLGAKVLGLGGAVIIKALEALGGGDFLRELGVFLKDFAEIIREFQRRGGDFDMLLRSEHTGAVVVTSTAAFAVREAEAFAARLREWGLAVDGVLLNRADPELPDLATAPGARDALQRAVPDPATREAVIDAYTRARALGERSAAARARLASVEPPLDVYVGERSEDPPETLPELRAFGRRTFGG